MTDDKKLDSYQIEDLLEAYSLLCRSKPKTHELRAKVVEGKHAIYGALLRKGAEDLVDFMVTDC